MLKISIHESGRFELAGRIAGNWVGELRAQCRPFLARRSRLILDLAQVSFADPAGAALLLELQQQRALLINCSYFVTEQLRSARHQTKEDIT